MLKQDGKHVTVSVLASTVQPQSLNAMFSTQN